MGKVDLTHSPTSQDFIRSLIWTFPSAYSVICLVMNTLLGSGL